MRKGATREEYNTYMREYMKKRYHERRGALVESMGGKCEDCGATENLEMHHKDRSTKLMVLAKRVGSAPIGGVIEEISKCQLLCDPCHNLKTLAEKGQKPAKGTHGTLSSYRYCKCGVCRRAKSEYTRNYRKVHSGVAELVAGT